jgi:hypothetical protein
LETNLKKTPERSEAIINGIPSPNEYTNRSIPPLPTDCVDAIISMLARKGPIHGDQPKAKLAPVIKLDI